MGSPVIVYSGHMFEQDCAEEPALAARIRAAIDELGATEAFGPLACGADILVAEAILQRLQHPRPTHLNELQPAAPQ